MVIRIGDGVCTSINFNLRAWYEVEIRVSDNPQQKETIDGIIWLRRKKCVIYRLDITFSIIHVAQSIVSKMNLFCQRDTKVHTTSGSWKRAMADCFYVTLERDVWINCSLYLRKSVRFQTWETFTSIKLRYFHCLSHSLYHGVNYF